MQGPKEPSRNLSQTPDAEPVDIRKPWATPNLKILPVPANTRGGMFAKNDQDDAFYKLT